MLKNSNQAKLVYLIKVLLLAKYVLSKETDFPRIFLKKVNYVDSCKTYKLYTRKLGISKSGNTPIIKMRIQ
jgi:hypothetical protein